MCYLWSVLSCPHREPASIEVDTRVGQHDQEAILHIRGCDWQDIVLIKIVCLSITVLIGLCILFDCNITFHFFPSKEITREPQFPSKRRVPFYPTQVSSSLQWEGRDPHPQRLERSRPVTPPSVKTVARATSVERERTPLAPRDGPPQEGTAAPSQQQVETRVLQPTRTTADQPKQRPAQNGVSG